MKKLCSPLPALLAGVLLSGCNWTVINPSGYVAKQQSNLLIFSVVLMLLIIVPVMFFTCYYAWKYRAGNQQAEYDPEFYHSNKLEFMVWGVPIAIILVLGTITWGSTHLLDPYRPLTRIDSATQIAGTEENLGAVKRLTNAVIDPKRSDSPATANVETLVIEVAALDWKWLFIYPEQGIATINEVAAPVNVPIEFKLTSASMMNSFYIPALAGQIYAMPGMQTRLHAVINDEGAFKGFSANYTGHGFSQMHFQFHGLSQAGFDDWAAKVRGSGDVLDRAEYLALDQFDQKDEKGHVKYFGTRHYGQVDPQLYYAILNMCVTPGAMCMDEMMHIDMAGGAGVEGIDNVKRLRYDRRRTQQAQIDLAEFSGVMPGDYVCTSRSVASDLDAAAGRTLRISLSSDAAAGTPTL
ncbi:ubiquinol oxidase subunit II [Corticibacter populi]|uniref:Ubiquinol oxidase subunit 2 n=1 Tax=Corticibacter populi TaxID=1550736 RepID=A0A3M6QXW6_9BURK|nr:ubiquinol oxidase subunit II [Corticibacter populi]RMX07865.1 ubiquinol oxidase subunit II [Corticibacter populi]RZS35101.1 cytochrome bo3 quinol oxidase subunit 2 [Corticibacter populi]